MCAIIGYLPSVDDYIDHDDARAFFSALMKESKIRGLHSFGAAWPGGFVRSLKIDDVIESFNTGAPTIAHCRYSTSGDWRVMENCQPIVVDDVSLAFNGVIHMGTREEFNRAFDVECVSENDGEIFVRKLLAGESSQKFIEDMTGSFAGVWLVDDVMWVGHNDRRPMWVAEQAGGRWIASTRDIFIRAGFGSYTNVREVRKGVHRVCDL